MIRLDSIDLDLEIVNSNLTLETLETPQPCSRTRSYSRKTETILMITSSIRHPAMDIRTLVVVALLLATASPTASVPIVRDDDMPGPCVDVESGRLCGLSRTASLGGKASTVFLGVPFAQPPVGSLRWASPAPLAGHGESTTTYATAAKSACPQAISHYLPTGSVNEDCLYLNVYAPATATLNGTSLLPVMVFIHGGSFTSGSATQLVYEGTNLATSQNVVVITVEYRVGVFGFLGMKEFQAGGASTGNYGSEDQRAALAWVQRNVAQFGGDKSKVTIFGESAGGMSVGTHVVNKKSQGLFSRAILESPAPWDFTSMPDAQAKGDSLAKHLNCSSATDDDSHVISCLRSRPPAAVFAAAAMVSHQWVPTVDNVEWDTLPLLMFSNGEINDGIDEVVIGNNAQEGSVFVINAANMTMKDATYRATLNNYYGETIGKAVYSHYPTSDFKAPIFALARAWGDAVIACPARLAAMGLSKAQNQVPVRYYVKQAEEDPLMGSYHTSELPYVFGNAVSYDNIPLHVDRKFTHRQRELSADFMTLWGAVAHGNQTPAVRGVAWPLFTPTATSTGEQMNFEHSEIADDSVKTSADAKQQSLCLFWNSTYPQLPSNIMAGLQPPTLERW